MLLTERNCTIKLENWLVQRFKHTITDNKITSTNRINS